MQNLLVDNYKPQDVGYRLFFTNKLDPEVVPMRYARATNNRNNYWSDPASIKSIKEDYFAGPMHFGMRVEHKNNHRFFDVDLKSAYPTWLINYAEGNFKYQVGGKKRYYEGLRYFNFNHEGMRIYKISFAVKTEGAIKSRLYRNWLLKTTKVNDLLMTNKYISGTISLPDIDDLVNRFLIEVQGYEDCQVDIDSIIIASGKQNVYINTEQLKAAMRIKNSPSHPLSEEFKLILNASTGYLAHADKVMYYTMVNQIRMELLKLMDAVDRWNEKRPDQPLSIVAANTDGVTIYAHESAEDTILDIINVRNNYSVFSFDLKEIYDLPEAHFTPNDIRKRKDVS